MKFLLVSEDKIQIITQGKRRIVVELPWMHKFYHGSLALAHRCSVIIRKKK